MKRRFFIKSATMGMGAVSLNPFPYHLYAGNEKKFAHDRAVLGSTGIEVSRMAMGTGTNGWNGSSNQTRKLGVGGLSGLLREAYDGGITFFESADQYGSHFHVAEAMKNIPREKVVVLTKTTAGSADEMKQDMDRFRKELNTDYIDIILLHVQTAKDWNKQKQGVMEVLARSREDGLLRAHGVSCHSLGALQTAADDPWAQVTLARLNPGEAKMDGSVSEVAGVLKRFEIQNKGLVVMKVLGGGDLVGKKDECLQFALAQSFIKCFTIGVESPEQLNDLQKSIPAASIRT